MKKGLHIYSVSEDTKREDLPKEVRVMFELIDSIIHNTTKICIDKDVSLTLLPSIYLQSFKKVTPMIVESILENGDRGKEEAQMYLNGLSSIVEGAFKVEKYK